MEKLIADGSQGMLAVIRCRNFVFQFATKNKKIKIHRNIILPAALCECITWSLTLREERRLKVFQNRVLRKRFSPKRNQVIWEWRRLNNEELNDLFSSSLTIRVIKSRRIRWAGYVASTRERRGLRGVTVQNLIPKLRIYYEKYLHQLEKRPGCLRLQSQNFLSPDHITDQRDHRTWSVQEQNFLPCRCDRKVQTNSTASDFMAVRFPCSAEDKTHSAVSPSTSASDAVFLYPNFLYHNC